MGKTRENKLREDIITNEIVVDAYDAGERMAGWYTYLEDTLQFPFQAKCIKEIVISPLTKNEKMTVVKMADINLCKSDMFVIIEWKNKYLGIPLEQISAINSDKETVEAIKNWQYWVEREYEF